MNRMKEMRIQRGWGQKELADRMHCKPNTISRYENEQLGLDAKSISSLCDIFDCTADYLLCRSDIRSYNLSPQEIALLIAYRAADARAREMVDLALRPFAPDAKKTETA